MSSSNTSSRNPLQHQTSSSSSFPAEIGGATKKKFGKNLNKLTKPPAAPPVGGGGGGGSSSSGSGGIGAAGNFRGSSSSRNGLLLLSTKTKSKSSTIAGAGGLLSGSSSKPSPPPSAPKSAHDALLSAAAGRIDSHTPVQQAPAWGISEKQQPSQPPLPQKQHHHQPPPTNSAAALPATEALNQVNDSKPMLVLAPRGGLTSNKRGSDKSSTGSAVDRSEILNPKKVDASRVTLDASSKPIYDARPDAENRAAGYRPSGSLSGMYRNPSLKREHEGNLQRSNSERGGRVGCGDGSEKRKDGQADDQVQYMSRLAKERAEKRRLEEDTRILEQKERAARRLRELEGKMSVPPASSILQQQETFVGPVDSSKSNESLVSNSKTDAPSKKPSTTQIQSARPHTRKVSRNAGIAQPSSQFVLERLGGPKKGNHIAAKSFLKSIESPSKGNGAKNSGRTLFDPSRTFSSLVGGSKAQNIEKQKEDLAAIDKNGSTVAQSNRPLLSRESKATIEPFSAKDDLPPVHMIQLDSYEDRDRGGRGAGTGPRMLFDPKSGSMVAVSARDDVGPSVKGGKKDRGKPKCRKDRDDIASNQKMPLVKRPDGGVADSGPQILTRRPEDVGCGNDLSDPKSLRKQKGRKEDSTLQRKDKRRGELDTDSLDVKSRQSGSRGIGIKHPKQLPRPRIPHTCGVLYKVDKTGNYVCADGCDADQGYGAHSVPSGRVRNPVAYAKLLKEEERHCQPDTEDTESDTNADDAVSGYSGGNAEELTFNDRVRYDPSFLKHQTNFEEQQQRVLEEAWSSLLEEEPKLKELSESDVDAQDNTAVQITSWPPRDTGLATGNENIGDGAGSPFSPSIAGLGFDPTENMDSATVSPSLNTNNSSVKDEPIDLAKFALDAATVGSSKPTNPFGPFGGLGSSTWGGGTPDVSSSLGDIGALTHWDFTTSNDIAPKLNTLNGGTTEASQSKFLSFPSIPASQNKTWGSSAFGGGLFRGGNTDSTGDVD